MLLNLNRSPVTTSESLRIGRERFVQVLSSIRHTLGIEQRERFVQVLESLGYTYYEVEPGVGAWFSTNGIRGIGVSFHDLDVVELGLRQTFVEDCGTDSPQYMRYRRLAGTTEDLVALIKEDS